MGVSPVQYLVVPRIVATTLMLPLLAVAFGMAGMVGAYLVAVVWQNIDPGVFFDRIHTLVELEGPPDARHQGARLRAHRERHLLQEGLPRLGRRARGRGGDGEGGRREHRRIFAADYVLTDDAHGDLEVDEARTISSRSSAAPPRPTHPGRSSRTSSDGRWMQMLYADLARDEVRLRAALARLGVKRGDKVAIISKNRPEWVVVMVAAARARRGRSSRCTRCSTSTTGATSCATPGAKVCFASTMAIDAKVRGMLGDLPALGARGHVRPRRASGRHLVRSPPRDRASPEMPPSSCPSPRDAAAYIYTSGTTGKPKGVTLSHAAFAFEARAMRDAWSVILAQTGASRSSHGPTSAGSASSSSVRSSAPAPRS